MMKLMMMAMSGQMQQLFEEPPEGALRAYCQLPAAFTYLWHTYIACTGMEEAHATVLSFIEALKADLGIDWDHVILIGFSQICPGNLREMSVKYPGNIREMSGIFPGNVQEISFI